MKYRIIATKRFEKDVKLVLILTIQVLIVMYFDL